MELKFKILIFLLHMHIAASYKSYKFTKLCPTSKFRIIVDALLDDKPNVELENSNDSSAAIVSQKWNAKTYKLLEHCDFKVIAKSPKYSPSRGIFASIRQMKLRKGSRNECVDYVIFEVGNGENQKSQKMCGTVEGDDVYDASNFFEAPGGLMTVVVHISPYVTLEHNEELGIELSFTPYDDCSDAFKLECEPKKCISKDLENDAVINCPPPNCADEQSLSDHCKPKIIYKQPSSHVLAISALSSLLMVMFGIVACWYCFKFRNCGEVNQTRNRNDSNRTGAIRPDMEFQTIQVPITPELATAPSMEDHDNPPSYDSLFRDRKVM